MSIAGCDPTKGTVNIKRIVGPATLSPEILQARLMGWKFIEEPKKWPRMVFTFDNSDGLVLGISTLVIGLGMEVSFGYPTLRSKILNAYARVIRGAMTRSPSSTSPVALTERKLATASRKIAAKNSAFGAVEIECSVYPSVLTRSPIKDIKSIRNMRLSAAIRHIAISMGFKQDKIFVQGSPDFNVQEEVAEEIQLLETETYGEFCARKAEELGYEFYCGEEEFHWHTENWPEAPCNEVEYFYGPDLLDFKAEGDFRTRISSASTKTHSVKDNKKLTSNSELGNFGLIIIGDEASMGSRPPIDFNDVRATISTKAFEQAAARVAASVRNKWGINLTLVGDPRLRRGQAMHLGNFGALIDGTWYIRQCEHVIDDSGFTTILGLRAKQPGRASGPIITKLTFNTETQEVGILHIGYAASLGKKKSRKKKGKLASDQLGPRVSNFEGTSRKQPTKVK